MPVYRRFLKQFFKVKNKPLALFLLVFAIAGMATLLLTKAATTPSAAVESENGTINAPATAINNINASAGNYIKFGSSVSSTLPNVQIPASGAYWGVIRDFNYVASGPNRKQRSIQQGESDLGRYYDIDRQFFKWNDLAANPIVDNTPNTPDNTYIEWTADNHHIPFINIVSVDGNANTVPFTAIYNTTTGTGMYDTYLHQLGRDLKTWGKPAFLTFQHEAESKICTGSNPSSCYGTDKEYIDAWRHIYDILHNQEGATNLSFVWVTAAYWWEHASPLTDPRYEPNFYPGNAYVDWLGVDPFNFVYTGTPDWTNWKDLCELVPVATKPPTGCPNGRSQSWYQWAQANAAGKPLMISAVGVIEDPNNATHRATWLNNAETYIKNNLTNVKGVIYYDQFPPDNEADTRIFQVNGNPITTQATIDAYKAWGLDSYFHTL